VKNSSPIAPRALPARARKPVVYDVGSDEDDDEFDMDDESEYESD